jgi:hypothetical protein
VTATRVSPAVVSAGSPICMDASPRWLQRYEFC